jgi:histone deacetylase HOS3
LLPLAYLEHDIDRAIILDIDLHHGNGTQDIALRLNSDTYHEELLVEGGKPAPANGKRGMKVFYGSVHDIVSNPIVPMTGAANGPKEGQRTDD